MEPCTDVFEAMHKAFTSDRPATMARWNAYKSMIVAQKLRLGSKTSFSDKTNAISSNSYSSKFGFSYGGIAGLGVAGGACSCKRCCAQSHHRSLRKLPSTMNSEVVCSIELPLRQHLSIA